MDTWNATPGIGIGFSGGLFASYAFSDMFGVQLEGLFSRVTSSYTWNDKPGSYSTNVIEIPVLAKAMIPAGPGNFVVFLGPEAQLAIGEVESFYDGEDAGSSKPDKNFAFAAAGGAGYELPLGPGFLTIDGRYVFQITGFSDDEWYTDPISAYVGYGMSF